MLFGKVGNSSKLFNKVENDGKMFRKISNTARKFDNSVLRVGSFIKPAADYLGLGNYVNDAVNGSHAVRNALEKSIRTPVNNLRAQFH